MQLSKIKTETVSLILLILVNFEIYGQTAIIADSNKRSKEDFSLKDFDPDKS